MNSFKQLEEEQIKLFAERTEDRVRNKLEGTLDALRFFGAVLEIYMPLMADTVVTLTGGEPSLKTDDDEPSLPPPPVEPDDKPRGPGGFAPEPPIR